MHALDLFASSSVLKGGGEENPRITMYHTLVPPLNDRESHLATDDSLWNGRTNRISRLIGLVGYMY